MKLEINVYVTNLSLYNEDLKGEWLTLPMKDFEREFPVFLREKVGVVPRHDEYFITDWESSVSGLCEVLKVDEYSSIKKLNNLLFEHDFDDSEIEILEAAFEFYEDFEQSVDAVVEGNYHYYDNCDSMDDVAMQIVEEMGYLDNVPDVVRNHFSYRTFGEELEMSCNFVASANGYYEFFRD